MTLALNHLLTLGVVPSLLQLLRPPHVEDAVLTNNVVGSLLNISHYPNGESRVIVQYLVQYSNGECRMWVNLASESDLV